MHFTSFKHLVLIPLQLFAYSQFLAVRKAHPDAKILCWSPAPTSGIIPILGPFGSDTKGLLARKTEERMRKTGEPFMEAAYNVRHGGDSSVVGSN